MCKKTKENLKDIFYKSSPKKGISLITLVITIIVIVILAGAVILTLAQNNPVESANEATFKSNVSEYQNELSLWLISKYGETTGSFDYTKVNANETAASYNGEAIEGISKITDIIASMKSVDAKKFIIEAGLLKYNLGAENTTTQEAMWAGNILGTDTRPTAQIDIASEMGSITGEIKLTDNGNGIDLSNTKYLVATTQTAYNDDDAIWSSEQAKTFDSPTQSISIASLTPGKYFIQVLLTDRLGTKKVLVSNELEIKLEVVQVSYSSNHTLVLLSNGKIKAFGANESGQLGNGTTVESLIPVDVRDITTAKEVYAGNSFSFALLNDGTVMAWGQNNVGQLGNGTTTGTSIPARVNNISDVKKIQIHTSAAIALLNDGTVYSWGYRIQNGRSGDLTNPTQVSSLSNVTQISATSSHNLVLLNDKTARSFGSNAYGMLGNNSTTNVTNTVAAVYNLSNVKELYSGNSNSFAILEDGTVKAWGRNDKGQLGNNSTNASGQTSPVALNNLANVKQIASGDGFTIFLKTDGSLEASGAGYYGQLGDGTNNDNSSRKTVPNIQNVKEISTNNLHILALLNDGTVKAWGRNVEGQIGNGSTSTSVNTPTLISGLTGVKKVYSFGMSSFVILNDGTLKVWGDNSYGQLGNGTKTILKTPTTITLF